MVHVPDEAYAALGSDAKSTGCRTVSTGGVEMDTVLDSADNVQSPMSSTAIAPIITSPASITELKSIIVFTSFL
jgi:hypothetical protein